MPALGSGRSSLSQSQVVHGAHVSCLDRKQALRMRLLQVSDVELPLVREVCIRGISCRLMAIWPRDLRKLLSAQGINCKIMQGTSCIVPV
jgi:hypothetical protein